MLIVVNWINATQNQANTALKAMTFNHLQNHFFFSFGSNEVMT